jgi:hypothetical protein
VSERVRRAGVVGRAGAAYPGPRAGASGTSQMAYARELAKRSSSPSSDAALWGLSSVAVIATWSIGCGGICSSCARSSSARPGAARSIGRGCSTASTAGVWLNHVRSGSPAEGRHARRKTTLYQVMPAVLGRRRATRAVPVRPRSRRASRTSPPPARGTNRRDGAHDRDRGRTRTRSHALAAVDEGTGRARGGREIKADDGGIWPRSAWPGAWTTSGRLRRHRPGDRSLCQRRASRGSAIRSRAELLVWRSGSDCR